MQFFERNNKNIIFMWKCFFFIMYIHSPQPLTGQFLHLVTSLLMTNNVSLKIIEYSVKLVLLAHIQEY